MGSALSSGSQSQSDNSENPQTVWWCRLLGRVLGAIGGIVSFICGILVLISLNGFCIMAGLLMLCSSVVVLVFEIPICFTFVEFTRPIANFSERITLFQRALLFGLLASLPILMCFNITTLFGNAPLFACAVLYGLMALGKKADRDDMISRAAGTQQQTPTAPASDAERVAGVVESGMKGKLMDNDFQNIAAAAANMPR